MVTIRMTQTARGSPEGIAEYVSGKMLGASPDNKMMEAPAERKDVAAYHVGGGWYQLPGVERKLRRGEAQELWEE